MTGVVMNGNAEAGVMVRTPAGGSVMANWIVFVPSAPLALASAIACRNEPSPVSLVVVTVNVAPRAACAASNPRSSPTINIVVFRVVFIRILPRKRWHDAFNYSRSFSENAIATAKPIGAFIRILRKEWKKVSKRGTFPIQPLVLVLALVVVLD